MWQVKFTFADIETGSNGYVKRQIFNRNCLRCGVLRRNMKLVAIRVDGGGKGEL